MRDDQKHRYRVWKGEKHVDDWTFLIGPEENSSNAQSMRRAVADALCEPREDAQV
jgi:hypothetical protein